MPKRSPQNVRNVQRRASDIEEQVNSRWRFSRTISLDSVIVLVVTMISGVIFVFTMKSDINQQARELEHVKEQTKAGIESVQKSVERVASDSEKTAARIEKDQAERGVRLELAIKETNALVQSAIVPRLQR